MLTEDLAGGWFDLPLASAKPLRQIEIDLDSAESVRIPDAHLMFQGEYSREGFDLVIENETSRLLISDYFRAAKRPTLEGPDGAFLTGDVVAALAISEDGLRYAQATPPAPQAAIGRVETVTGQATVIRNGTPVVVNQGDLVFKGDVVQTDRGSSLGITFIDGSTFSLGAGARMVLNDMVYQAGGAQNSALLNIVQGSVTFLAGQIAKSGEMRVGTPVATMGIRGTLVKADIDANNGTTSFAVIQESDGRVGSFVLRNQAGDIIATISQAGQVTTVSPSGTVSVQQLSPAEMQDHALAAAIVYQIAAISAANPLLPGMTGPGGPAPGGGGGGGGGSSDPGNGSATPPLAGLQGSGGLVTPFSLASADAPFTPVPTVTVQAIGFGGGGGGSSSGAQTEASARVVTLAKAGRAQDAGDFVAVTGDRTAVTGEWGTLFINPDGSYSYVADRAAPLPQGAVGQDVFTYQLGSGADAELVTLDFTVTGVNDAPQLANFEISLPEQGSAGSSSSGAGTIGSVLDNANDPDTGDTLAVTDARSAGGNGSGLVNGQFVAVGTYGTLTMNPDGTFTYTANAAAARALGSGEVGRDTFTYTVTDAGGLSSTARMDFLVQGVNDVATIAGTTSGDAVEIGDGQPGSGIATGLLTIQDPDAGQAAFRAVTTPTASANGYGTFTITADGLWSYTLDDTNPAVQALKAGQSTTDTFTVLSADGTQQTITVTITGSNDAPTVSGPVLATIGEDTGTASLDLLAGASDVDADTILGIENLAPEGGTPGELPPGFSLSEDGRTLLVDTGHSAFADLGAGESRIYRFTYDIVDDQGARVSQTVEMLVQGVNDPATISGTTSGDAVEIGDGQPGSGIATGLLTIQDPDAGQAAFRAVTTPTASANGYGTFTITADGQWSYTLDDTNPAVQALKAGQSTTDTFAVLSADGTEQTITVTITGSNDAPTVSGPVTATIGENTGTASLDLLAGASDVDADTVLGIENLAPEGGTPGELPPGFSLSEDGRTLLVDTGHPEFADLAAGASRTYRFTCDVVDDQGARVSQTVEVTVTGSGGGLEVDGSFETGFTGWSLAGDTSLVQEATDGVQAASITTSSEASIGYSEIESFLGVPADSLARDESTTHTSNDATIGSAIRTNAIRLEAGQTLRFDWNFSTDDYRPFNDFAVFTIDELDAIFALADVESVGDFGSTGWRTFYFTARVSGDYHFGFAVFDTGDGAVASTLLIDNLRVESNGAPILTGAVTGTGLEGTGTFSVDLLSGASDPQGSSLHVENVRSANAPEGLPPGFSWNGSSIEVDSEHPVFQALAQGETREFSFTYEVVDETGARTSQTARVTVQGTNDGPTSASETIAVQENGIATAESRSDGVLANDSDPDANETDTLFVGAARAGSGSGTFTTVPAAGLTIEGLYGTLTLYPDGTYFYTADRSDGLPAGETAEDSFLYEVVDTHGARSTATLTFSVTGVNNPPTAGSGSFTTEEDTAVTGSLPAASDPDGDAVTYALASGPEHGSVAVSASGTFTYTPSADYSGPDSFSYTVADGNGGSATYTVALTVTGVNDAPTALADSSNVAEDETATGNVLANDTDPDSDAVLTVTGIRASAGSGSFASSASGIYGTVTIASDGTYSYVADNTAAQALAEGETATDIFTYRITDEHGAASTASLTVTVTGANDAPTAVADTGDVAEDATSTGNVLTNDTDPDSDAVLTVTGIRASAGSGSFASSASGVYGTVTIASDGTYSYVADHAAAQALAQGETATDTFTYRVTDEHGAASTASLTVTVTGANDAPTAEDAAFTTEEDTALGGILPGSDPDSGDTLTYSASFYSANSGTISFDTTTGNFTYTPPADFSGTDSFTYTVTDAAGATSTGTVSIEIAPVNDPAVFNEGEAGTGTYTGFVGNEGIWASQNFTVFDPDGENTATLVEDGATENGHGIYWVYESESDGFTWEYWLDWENPAVTALAEGDLATDSFDLVAADGTRRTVTITIEGWNDGPVGENDENALSGGEAAGNVLANDTDPDQGETGLLLVSGAYSASGSFIAIDSADSPATVAGNYGTLILHEDGNYEYQVGSGTFSPGEFDRFEYSLVDPHGSSSTAELSIQLAPPDLADDRVITTQTGLISIPQSALLVNDGAEGLAVRGVTSPASLSTDGTIEVGTSPGTFGYTADSISSTNPPGANVEIVSGATGLTGTGADEIILSSPGSVMTGGGGRDVFVAHLYDPDTEDPAIAARITDFDTSEDAIDLSFWIATGNYSPGDGWLQLRPDPESWDHLVVTLRGDVVAHLDNLDVTSDATAFVSWHGGSETTYYSPAYWGYWA
ncbi:VCBS domain-containing protein [Enterovirga sp. CN4-39]|uniref:VCBS domain-containing protein n=1 Tax=Enterovirga sp. CN4-39 TaxID=3400910 RepID=UPI003C12AB0F